MIRPGIRRAFERVRGRREALEADVDEEIRYHLELRAQQFVDEGMSPDGALAEARRRFGSMGARRELLNVARARESRMQWRDWVEGVASDVRYAARQLRRSPGFTAAATLTLALGIGANATMFGIIDRLLLRPPAHVVDPARVVTASLTRRIGGDPSDRARRDTQEVLSYSMYQDLRAATRAFEQVAAYRTRTLTLGGGATAKPVRGMATTASYFPALGVRPSLGRFYNGDEADNAPGARVVVLSHAFWNREFGANPNVVGQSIEVAGQSYAIIGVAPRGFTGLEPVALDLWIPLTAGVGAASLDQWKRDRESFFLLALARLRPSVTLAEAERVGSAGIRAGYLASGDAPTRVERIDPGIALVTAQPRDARRGQAEARVAELLGAVSLLVLLLACANVANLQLARTIKRQREIAVRLALGVARRRLLRQLALDSVLLAMIGGAAALLVAHWGGLLVRRTLVSSAHWDGSPVDGRVLVFTAVVALVAGIATGLVPAAQALGADFTHWLRSGSRAGDDRSAALRMPLLVLQAGLTFVLLTGTALFVTSLRRVHAVPLGLDADRVLSVLVNTAGRSYSEDERASMYDRLLATALETPGIAHGALGTTMPFRSASALAVFIPGRDSVPLTSAGGPYINVVSSRFFETMGTRMIDGRGFRATDRAGSPPVVVVNDVAAKMWWPGERAVGKCIKLDADTMPCAEVVGVATIVHRFSIVEDASAQLYAPLGQVPSQGSAGVLFVRPHGDARSAIAPLQRRLQTSIAGLPYVSVEPMSDVIAPRLQSWRMGATMFGVFGVLALVLATIGLYSVLAYDVAQRTGELGVRVALGAMTLDIVRLVVGRGVRVVLVGVAIGVLVTLVAARFVAPLLFHTSPRDPLILTGVGLTLLAVSLAATWIPARRAAGVDPASALREA